MASVKSYFESHAHHTAYHRKPEVYLALSKHLPNKDRLKILDVGCGDGSFIKELIALNINAEFIGIDVSHKMLSSANHIIKSHSVDFCLADAFNMPLLPNHKFDVIHIDSVLHHLIGATKGKSMILVKKMVSLLVDELSDGGVLMVDEYYYNSHIIKSLTSSIIFYALKVLNFFHIDAKTISEEIHPGLEVNFLTEDQINSFLLEHTSAVNVIGKKTYMRTRIKQILFLKEYGYISILASLQKQ